MRKRILFIAMAIGLILATLIPGPALAAPKFVDFSSAGSITFITPGDVLPAGDSGRFRVIEREIDGTLLMGSITGDYALIYKANVELTTQAGNLQGTLNTGSYSFKVIGHIQPLEFVTFIEVPGIPFPVPVYYLEINGQWNLVNGQGNGDFTAGVYFVPTPDGHVAFIVDGGFVMTGKWKP